MAVTAPVWSPSPLPLNQQAGAGSRVTPPLSPHKLWAFREEPAHCFWPKRQGKLSTRPGHGRGPREAMTASRCFQIALSPQFLGQMHGPKGSSQCLACSALGHECLSCRTSPQPQPLPRDATPPPASLRMPRTWCHRKSSQPRHAGVCRLHGAPALGGKASSRQAGGPGPEGANTFPAQEL